MLKSFTSGYPRIITKKLLASGGFMFNLKSQEVIYGLPGMRIKCYQMIFKQGEIECVLTG
jgi:hypothetical protein